ncbi:hypothetical protein LPJ61_003447, partial [Coemansia biformis]
MVHESSLDKYVYDYIKRRGYHQTALCLANECKGLPLVIAADDPQLGDPQGQIPHGACAPPVPSSASPTTSDTTGPASASADAAPPPYVRVPSIILPYNSHNGLLLDWWVVFWDVHIASRNLLQPAGVPDRARIYVQHQHQAQAQAQRQAQRHSRGPSSTTLNANGKRGGR